MLKGVCSPGAPNHLDRPGQVHQCADCLTLQVAWLSANACKFQKYPGWNYIISYTLSDGRLIVWRYVMRDTQYHPSCIINSKVVPSLVILSNFTTYHANVFDVSSKEITCHKHDIQDLDSTQSGINQRKVNKPQQLLPANCPQMNQLGWRRGRRKRDCQLFPYSLPLRWKNLRHQGTQWTVNWMMCWGLLSFCRYSKPLYMKHINYMNSLANI